MKRVTFFLLILSALFVAPAAFAGANNRDIACKDAAGKIWLSGKVPGDFDEWYVEVTTEKGETIELTKENSTLEVTENRKKRVYRIVGQIHSPALPQYIDLKAAPATYSYVGQRAENTIKFGGTLIVGLIHNDGREPPSLTKHVSCVGKYEI